MRPVIRLRLTDVCFAHWPVDPDEMAAHVPGDASLDVRDGRAWVTVVGMGVRPRFLLGGRAYAQVNVRTYLAAAEPSVYFRSILANDRLAAMGSRVLADVPTRYARVAVDRTGQGCRVRCDAPDGVFEAEVQPEGDPEPVEEGTLAHWLVERYHYVTDDGTTRRIDHPPWRIQEASGEVTARDLLADLPEPTGEAVFHYSPGVVVEA